MSASTLVVVQITAQEAFKLIESAQIHSIDIHPERIASQPNHLLLEVPVRDCILRIQAWASGACSRYELDVPTR